MLVCIPTLPGYNDFEIEADSIAAAAEMAEDYCKRNDIGEKVMIDYQRPAYIMEDIPRE